MAFTGRCFQMKKDSKKILFNEALDKFKRYLIVTGKSKETVRSYFFDLRNFSSFLEKKYNCQVYLDEVGTDDIEEYLYYLKDSNLKNSSRSRNLYTLRSLYNFLYKNKLCEWNTAMGVEPIKVQTKERTFLTPDEVAQLINSIEQPLVMFAVETMYYTGLRISECLKLRLQDVDLEEKVIHVIEGKGNKDRDIPISRHLLEILSNYLLNYRPDVQSEYFFATKKTGRLSAPYVNRIINETVKKLNWKKHVSAHILRHSFASNLIKNGVSLVYVQKLLGHSNLKVTSIYTHTGMDELDKSVNVL